MKKGRGPFLRLYPKDWLDRASRINSLTAEQECAYFRLCLFQFVSAKGLLPTSETVLAAMARTSDYEGVVAPVLAQFFESVEGGYSNQRVREEWLYSKHISEVGKAAIKARWEAGDTIVVRSYYDRNTTVSEGKLLQQQRLLTSDAPAATKEGPQGSKPLQTTFNEAGAVVVGTTKSKNARVIVGTSKSSNNQPLTTPTPSSPLERLGQRYIECFNAVFKRRLALTPGVLLKIKQRTKDGYRGDQILAQPILVAANTPDPEFLRSVQPEWLLRDGQHARTMADGTTRGATNWLERELARMDRTLLYPQLAEVAREMGLIDVLTEFGVGIRAPAERDPEDR